MCLSLVVGLSAKQRKNLRRRKTPIIAYKRLRRNNRGLFSPYRHVRWYILEEMVSDRTSVSITKEEHLFQEIHRGLHFDMNKDVAVFNAQRNSFPFNEEEVWEAQIQPRDIVASGYFGPDRSIVSTKARLVRCIYSVKGESR